MNLRRLITAAALALLTAVATACTSGNTDDPASPTPPPVIDTTTAPPQLSWDTYRGVKIPRSAVAGPSHRGAVDTGYQQSPHGAALAAIRGQAYLALAGDDQWGGVVAAVTAPGPGRNDFAAQRAPLSINGDVPPEQAIRFVAFKIDHYTAVEPVTAAVQIVTEVGSGPNPARFAYPVALQWLGGDWRIVLPTADKPVDATEPSTLDGFVRLEG